MSFLAKYVTGEILKSEEEEGCNFVYFVHSSPIHQSANLENTQITQNTQGSGHEDIVSIGLASKCLH